ncbi:TrkH family potassium uptake protein [Sporosarcina oncorhynchi]|uniref:TrkH family potassium uptake protein n=1 Tax=Sporosarcina oncorhynchi TaxID=3056444 RepID=A0ABZ0L6F4_9BACL|nr:TrkH family potassium uptake protein [Sporosarcina sp. T2O-4]WOV88149.1 TrkH family potassium uptake protein [Sporosarcina sp. T2O-4]
MKKKKSKRHLSPPVVIAGNLFLLIVIGTLLLKLPIATEHPISWIDAFFTVTSATTVTGLVVFDPGTTLTLFGEIVLLFLIQIGGISLMVFAVFLLVLLGRKVGMQKRIYIQATFSIQTLGGMVSFVRKILAFVFIVEGFAVILLSIHWIPQFGIRDGIYYSVFHVISAFNNAGFSLFPDNLSQFVGDPFVNIVLSSLLIIGGIGFVVVIDILQSKSIHKWSLHTKLMVTGTIALNLVATLLIFVLEFTNVHTIGNLSLADKVLASYFQAVSPRTAGFNTISIGDMEDSSLLVTMFLMFVGGGSASTASGIKLTTFIVILIATISYFRAIREPHVFGRTIKFEIIFRSLAIATVSIMIIFSSLFVLAITETIPVFPLAFEVFSAFGTVGLSMGVTEDLTDVGRVLLCIVMFLGRIGPLTLFFLLLKPKKETYRFPYDQVQSG